MNTITAAEALNALNLGLPLIDCKVKGTISLYPTQPCSQKEIRITNSIIESFDAVGAEFRRQVFFDNVEFGDCRFNSAYFEGGLEMWNCRFLHYLDFEAGGHNENGNAFIIRDCKFKGFVNFFDCWFKSIVIIRDNSFEEGSNLLGNSDKVYRTHFDTEPIIINNQGDIDLDGEGGKQVHTIHLGPIDF